MPRSGTTIVRMSERRCSIAALYHLDKSTRAPLFEFTLCGPDGQTLLFSATYFAKELALSAIEDCMTSSSFDDRYQRLFTTSGPFSFHLLNLARQVIARSNDYASIEDREAAIAACKRSGPTAALQDNT